MPPTSLAVRPIRADDDFKSLSLGHKDYVPLKTFLKRDAWDFECCCAARTHVLVDADTTPPWPMPWLSGFRSRR
jgi:hypothetical protein